MRKFIPIALGMVSLFFCSYSYADITVQNSATPDPQQTALHHRHWWDWSIYLAGSASELSKIRCVTYHLHPTFPYPNRRVCYDDNSDPQHAFAISTDGWGIFPVSIDVLFKDGTRLSGWHQLDFATSVSSSTLLSIQPRMSEEQQEIADYRSIVERLERERASASAIADLRNRVAALEQRLAAANAAPPPSPATNYPKYKITLGNMTVWNGVAQGPGAKDTDAGTLFVMGPQGEYGPRPWGSLDLGASPVPVYLGDSVSEVLVPNDQHSAITISWNAVNAGHGNTTQMLNDLGDAAADAAKSSDNPWAVLAGVIGGAAVDFGLKNCDTPLFAEKVTYDGATLYNLNGHDDWTSEGPNKWHRVFDYPHIVGEGEHKCDAGRYNLEIHVERIAG
jgi:transcription initiation factor IIF auxiliary subunit